MISDITEFRKQYPQYGDLSDEQVAENLHSRYYSDMPKEDFFKTFLPAPAAPSLTQRVTGAISGLSTSPMLGSQPTGEAPAVGAIADEYGAVAPEVPAPSPTPPVNGGATAGPGRATAGATAGPSALEIIQRIKGTPVGPGMPTSVAEVAPMGLNERGQKVLLSPETLYKGIPEAVANTVSGIAGFTAGKGYQAFETLGRMIMGSKDPVGEARQVGDRISAFLTYEPQSESGKELAGFAGGLMNAPFEAIRKGLEVTRMPKQYQDAVMEGVLSGLAITGAAKGAVRKPTVIETIKNREGEFVPRETAPSPTPPVEGGATKEAPTNAAVQVPNGTEPAAAPSLSPMEIAKEHVLKGNEKEGLTPQAVERIAGNIAYDAGMPGFFRKEYIRPFADKAVEQAKNTGEEISRTHMDIGNLTGINNTKGHEAANTDIRNISGIIKQAFEEHVPADKLHFGREGGDEMSVYARGVSKSDLDSAAQNAKIRVEQYAKDNGLLQLPSKRGIPEDVSLHTNTENINEFLRNNPKAATADFLKFNDAKLQRKEEASNVTRSQAREAGVAAPEGQAAGVERSPGPDNQPVRTETAEPAAATRPAEVAPQTPPTEPVTLSEHSMPGKAIPPAPEEPRPQTAFDRIQQMKSSEPPVEGELRQEPKSMIEELLRRQGVTPENVEHLIAGTKTPSQVVEEQLGIFKSPIGGMRAKNLDVVEYDNGTRAYFPANETGDIGSWGNFGTLAHDDALELGMEQAVETIEKILSEYKQKPEGAETPAPPKSAYEMIQEKKGVAKTEEAGKISPMTPKEGAGDISTGKPESKPEGGNYRISKMTNGEYGVFDKNKGGLIASFKTEEEAKQNLPSISAKKIVRSKGSEYQGSHRPVTVQAGAARLDDLTPAFGEDIYGKNAVQYFGTGNNILDRQTLTILKSLRGNPEKEVTVYRAIPKDAPAGSLSYGDWVTVNKDYAKQHGESTLEGKYKIVSQKVKANDLTTNADSFHEQGYYPENKTFRSPKEGDQAAPSRLNPAEEATSENPETGSVTLSSFPGGVGKVMRRMFGIDDAGQMKWVERAFDRIGEHISPEWKGQFVKFFRTPAFYVEEHPAAEPLFLRNIERGENNHRDNRFVFDVDEKAGHAGIGPILSLGRAEMKELDGILVRGDRDKIKYSPEELRQKFKATDRVVSAYEAARGMIERLQSVIVEKRQEIALSPYEVDPGLHDKLSRVMDDLVELTDPKDRKDYMDRLNREQADILDHQTKVALDRVARHVEGIHEDISRFEANPGYIPRVREEGAYHVRAVEHILTPEESRSVLGAIMYGRKARKTFEPEELQSKFKITGKAAEVYKDALEEMRDDPVLTRKVENEADVRKAIGRIVDSLATREVFMQPANTYSGAKLLQAKVSARPGEYFGENYDPKGKYEYTIAENKRLPEEVYADIGNPAAREAIIERAILRAEAKGAISVSDAEAITDQILGAMNEEQLKRGAGRSFLQRSENLIEGYKTEKLDKILSDHITGMVGYLNKALYSVRGLRDMEDIKDPNVTRWANKYYKNSLKNSGKLDQWIGKARGAAVFYRLGGVLKTMVQNSFQQAQTGFAEMSRFTSEPAKILATAEKDVLARHLTEFDKKVLAEGIESGMADAQYMRNIAGVTERGPERGFSRVVDASMKGFGIVETEMNRKPALLAAMRLFTGQKNRAGEYYGVGKNGKPYNMSFDEAMVRSKQFVRSTHYEISRANEPEIVQDLGPIARGAYTFQSYTANQLNWLFNRARHGEAGVLGRFMLVTWALGGLAAAPFSDEIDAWLTKHYGMSIKQRIRLALRDELGAGRDMEDLIMNGLPAYVFGVDMSKAVQLNTPLPIQMLLGTDKSLEERASGAIGGLVVSGGRAMEAAGKGDFGRAAEYALPNAAGNVLRAWRLYREGATTMHGKPITDERGRQLKLTGPEAAGKALGFQSARMNRYQEANTVRRNLKEYWEGDRQDLLDRYRIAIAQGADPKKVIDDIKDWNKRVIADKGAKLIVSPIDDVSLRQAIMQKPGLGTMRENKFKQEFVGR